MNRMGPDAGLASPAPYARHIVLLLVGILYIGFVIWFLYNERPPTTHDGSSAGPSEELLGGG